MTVLVIATAEDPHTQAVVEQLERLGGMVRVANLAEFPASASLSLRYTCCGTRSNQLSLADGPLNLDDVNSVWWRRPQTPEASHAIRDETHRLFAINETQEALTGLWYALDVSWINELSRDDVAHRKIAQLRRAHDVGLRVPDTLVTNAPQDALEFVDSHGYARVIYKTFSALPEVWRETRILRPDEVELIDSVQYAPVIFQEYVEAKYDLRVTIVGHEIYAAAIHSQETAYPVDFRMDLANARIEPVELPLQVAAKLLEFMKSCGLVYGAIDMRLRPDGEYVFLEINPAGQWLFIEEATHQPIAEALARALLDSSRS